MMRIYNLYGLAFRSEIPLPTRSTARHWDIELLWGRERTIPSSLPEGRVIASLRDGAVYSLVDAGDLYVIRFPQICDFHVSKDLRRVVVDRALGQAPFVELIAAASLPAFLLGLMGEFCLHASGVAVGGRGVAFVGSAGAGKSTLAALSCMEGAELVGDDLLRLEDGAEGLFAHVGSNAVRIRAASAASQHVRTTGRGRLTADNRFSVSFDTVANPVPLTLMIVPRIGKTTHEVAVKRIGGSSALRAATFHARVLGWKEHSRSASQFRMLANVARRVPTYHLQLPLDPTSFEKVGRDLIHHLSVALDDRKVVAG